MKKILLTFSLAAMFLTANAQKVIITGIMFDPQGADAPSTTTQIANGPADTNHKGGYEYIQLMATEDIDFSQKPHCIVTCSNAGTSAGAATNGWAEKNSARTFKFSITSGTVRRGEFFYVGGEEKTAGGFLAAGGVYYPVLNMSNNGAKWMRTIPYSVGTNANAIGDDGVGMSNTGLLTNTVVGSSSRPFGIAVFEGKLVEINNVLTPSTEIGKDSVPVDVVFLGYSANNVLAGSSSPTHDRDNIYVHANAPSNCYRVPKTDRYTAGYMGDANNQYVYSGQPVENLGNFLKFGGVFNTDDHTWHTPRTANYAQLCPPQNTTYPDAAARTAFAHMDMLEKNMAGYNGTSVEPTKLISPLPVKLTTFTAKATKQGTVNLNWSTASEQNNSHFEVNRSTDATNFTKIGEIAGNGTTNTTKNYNYTDNSPVGGVNYYQLKQVDFDGKSTLSQVTSAKVGLSQNNVSVSASKSAVAINYKALATGKATFTVYSVSGAKLASVTQNVNVGANQVSIPVQLGSSLHLLQVQQAGEGVSVKF